MARIDLSDMIVGLRKGLQKAQAKAADENVKFKVESIDIEAQVTVSFTVMRRMSIRPGQPTAATGYCVAAAGPTTRGTRQSKPRSAWTSGLSQMAHQARDPI